MVEMEAVEGWDEIRKRCRNVCLGEIGDDCEQAKDRRMRKGGAVRLSGC